MRILCFLLIYLFANPIFATSITNQELINACKDKSTGPQNFCYGFIISAANAAQFYRNLVDVPDEYIDICFPDKITNKEMVDLYVEWVEQNPSIAKSPAFIGVSTSFSTKYSCKLQKEEQQPLLK